MTSPQTGMKSRWETFCQLYAAGGITATEAYRKAGFSPRNASSGANRLLQRPEVQARIAELQAPALERAALTISEALEHLGDVARTELPLEPCRVCGQHGVPTREIVRANVEIVRFRERQQQRELEIEKLRAQAASLDDWLAMVWED